MAHCQISRSYQFKLPPIAVEPSASPSFFDRGTYVDGGGGKAARGISFGLVHISCDRGKSILMSTVLLFRNEKRLIG